MIKSKRLGAIKFQIAKGGLESRPLRGGTRDSDAYLYSRHKIPLTYGREFLPIERTQRLNRIFFTHCSPPDVSRVGEIRHRRPIREVASKDYARVAPSVEKFRPALHPIFSVEPHHEARLVIQCSILAIDPSLKGKISGG